jgi:exonuclease VII small subunit
MAEFASLAERLESIVDDLDELALDRLREAVANGVKERPQSDRELTKARRAVEKAAVVLRRLDEIESDAHSAAE